MRSRWWRLGVFVGMPLAATTLCTLESLRSPAGITVTSESVTVGDVVRRVAVSGQLVPLNTVDVVTPVSGTIAEVDVDLNANVKAGQVLLRLENSEFQAVLDAARNRLTEARAEVARMRTSVDTAAGNLNRIERLRAQNLIPALDLDAARTAVVQADADLEAASERLDAAMADVRQANVSLQQTVVRSPVDGIVVGRAAATGAPVDTAQSAPPLFRLAADVRTMQVTLDLDESDVASMAVGAAVALHVDAFPDQTFAGHVTEVLVDAGGEQFSTDGATGRFEGEAGVQSPFSCPVVITVENPDAKLRPGMTAIVSLDGARRDHATRIPNAALQFTPSPDILTAAHQKMPDFPPALPPDKASTGARVWAYDGTEFTSIQIRVGLSDDRWTELVSGPLEAGTTLVTAATADTRNSEF